MSFSCINSIKLHYVSFHSFENIEKERIKFVFSCFFCEKIHPSQQEMLKHLETSQR